MFFLLLSGPGLSLDLMAESNYGRGLRAFDRPRTILVRRAYGRAMRSVRLKE